MDMDMDTAWCLTCSKQTHDPRNPYCSEQCRLEDTVPPTPSSGPANITSPLPLGLISVPLPQVHSGNPTPKAGNSPGKRPHITPLLPVIPLGESSTQHSRRDRRAFSFPAEHSVAPPPVSRAGSRRQTQGQDTLQFIRKTNPVSVSALASPNVGGITQTRTKGFNKLSKTTGANTPVVSESVFCSTSESSENEGLGLLTGPPITNSDLNKFGGATVRPPQMTHRTSLLNAFRPSAPRLETTKSSPLPAVHSQFVGRKSPSPVAALIASSASSKSRDDIVSWLNEVKRLPEDDALENTYVARGRSRTKKEVLANLPPPDQDALDEQEGESGMFGTTPKGRIGSALAGLSNLSSFRVGPIVKALTSVTSPSASVSPQNSRTNQPVGLGLQSIPAPAEVSPLAVTVGIMSDNESIHINQLGGATPTLSTVSFSEVVDPLTDGGEHIEFMTDDQSVTESSVFAHRMSISSNTGKAAATLAASSKKADRQTPLPLRPITTTASAIWNLSTYLRSFSPFSISSVMATNVPNTVTEDARPGTAVPPKDSPAKQWTPDMVPSPMPTSARPVTPDDETSPALQMVRSLPMDIVLPLGGETANLERLRQKEVQKWLETNESRSRSGRPRGRDTSRSRMESRSRSRVNSRSGSYEKGQSHSRHGRMISYDADASGEDDVVVGAGPERRGRSRREKVLRQESDERTERLASSEEEEEELVEVAGRGRGRGRGREKTVRA
ncbi:hypothetical protein CI109_106883 [Kwoniella shandongensis]|uniref:Uncharacterized protein n=1 Tax=Kwoniella shandongensis TaxID=1734106 RepID=A0A5M6C747_9TREE|nr:uncharacterized protein CI109_000861 [Kwoniella shandongensis]KAA5530681.1 hypothetical protein CI109_000861 [Kwoniella shandongensis]